MWIAWGCTNYIHYSTLTLHIPSNQSIDKTAILPLQCTNAPLYYTCAVRSAPEWYCESASTGGRELWSRVWKLQTMLLWIFIPLLFFLTLFAQLPGIWTGSVAIINILRKKIYSVDLLTILQLSMHVTETKMFTIEHTWQYLACCVFSRFKICWTEVLYCKEKLNSVHIPSATQWPISASPLVPCHWGQALQWAQDSLPHYSVAIAAKPFKNDR